jgi:hypothetical protein
VKQRKAKRERRANPPVCWLCDRQLYGGGWYYADVTDEDGSRASGAQGVRAIGGGMKKPHRECFEWCPHGTFNPEGCGICIERRAPIEECERLREALATVTDALTIVTTAMYYADHMERDEESIGVPRCPECRESIMYMPHDCGTCERIGGFITDDSIRAHRMAMEGAALEPKP